MAEQLFELGRKTFDTPHFRGITFIEVEAKTIINHVPGDRLPFNFTINPYRGCSHACSYCMAGDTPILMADGRTKVLEDLRVGDKIYGTERRGTYRRYVTTEVLAHWSTMKPAYRITLEDGTELVASGDHRFLTDRGWKYVTGTQQGATRRQHLTVANQMMGTGRLERVAVGPAELNEARIGVPSGAPVETTADQRIASVERTGVDMLMFDITTGTGDFIANGIVSHNCFARTTHTYMDMNAGRDFESKIVVKVNAPELLRKELRARKWKGEHIAMGTATDPYQRAEGRYKIMPRIIEMLTEFRNPFSILTKGTLITRDLELLQKAAEVTDVSTAFSIGTLDEDAWAKSEPGTPHPRKRMEIVRRLNEAGIPCGVMLAPILPGISDHPDQLRAVIESAFDAGATHVSPILLHLRPGVKEEYMGWLEQNYPELVARYMSMYDRRSYARENDRNALSKKVEAIKKATARPKPRNHSSGPRWRSREQDQTPKARSEQLSLI
ncbi:MAG: radical SAM protein [Actinomycetota bacterium]